MGKSPGYDASKAKWDEHRREMAREQADREISELIDRRAIEECMYNLGSNLKYYIRHNDTTMERFATKASVNRMTLERISRKKTKDVSLRTLLGIAHKE